MYRKIFLKCFIKYNVIYISFQLIFFNVFFLELKQDFTYVQYYSVIDCIVSIFACSIFRVEQNVFGDHMKISQSSFYIF